jgi:hypothetical protein
VNASQATDRPKDVLYPAATRSLLAALIHLWVIPEHFAEWWGLRYVILSGSRSSSRLYPAPVALAQPDRSQQSRKHAQG